MSNIVKAEPVAASLPDMVRYAEHLADSGLLPRQYQGKPANVLYAMEYGRTLGITPLAAITGIHVIDYKPTASAALISGLVRQAGHKLRVRVENGPGGPRAIAEIVRADDPDFTFRSEWDMDRARAAKLAGKEVWQKYPQAMLKARAITEVARDACEEVLFGLHYTPEELDANVDQEGVPVDAPVQQLRPVQPGEPDPWATPAPQPQRDYVAEARAAATADEAVRIYREAEAARVPGEMLAELVEIGRAKRAIEQQQTQQQDDGVVEGEIVPDDDHAAAVAELRAAAAAANLEDFDNGAALALGCPIAQATPDAIRALASQISGHAA